MMTAISLHTHHSWSSAIKFGFWLVIGSHLWAGPRLGPLGVGGGDDGELEPIPVPRTRLGTMWLSFVVITIVVVHLMVLNL